MGDTLAIAVTALFVAAWARPYSVDGLRALHLLQLEEYQTRRYWRWLATNLGLTFDAWMVGSAALVLVVLLVLRRYGAISMAAIGAIVGGWQTFWRTIPEAKKPLVLTARARRLLGGWAGCAIAIGIAVGWQSASRIGGAAQPSAAAALAVLILALFSWPLMSLANLLLYPVEAGFRQYYLADSRSLFRRYLPLRIC